MTIPTTDLHTLISNAPKESITIEGGERFIQLPEEFAIQTSELSGLVGTTFNNPYEDVFVFHQVNTVQGEIYENVDGIFLTLRIQATFLYGEDKDLIEEGFTIWIPEADGEAIEAGDFNTPTWISIEAELLDPILNRFSL